MALAVGLPHPDFLPPMSSRQWAEAKAFWRLEPYGGWVDDVRAARLLSTLQAAHFSGGSSVKDCMLAEPEPNIDNSSNWTPERRKKMAEQFKAILIGGRSHG